jgi:hypothetical protein
MRKSSKKRRGTEDKCRCSRAINIWKPDFGNEEKLAMQDAWNCSDCGEEYEETIAKDGTRCGEC